MENQEVGTLGEPALPLVFVHAGAAAPRPYQLVGKPRRGFPLLGSGTRLQASYEVGTVGDAALPRVFVHAGAAAHVVLNW